MTVSSVPLASAALALVLLTGCGAPEPPPNVLFITVDTLRADRLGAFGHPRGPSPAIDRLLADGASFPAAIVPRGQTWPTLASLQTSLYPVTHGIRKNGQSMRDDAVGLAEVLGAAGWRCGAFLSNAGQAGWKGFDPLYDRRDRDAGLTSAAAEWIRRRADERFFLWLHLFGPHHPFAPPEPLDDLYDPGYAGPLVASVEQIRRINVDGAELPPEDVAHALALYDGEIRALDRLIDELLARLDALGLGERTLVVFTSDHGEELYERNRYFSHSASIYDSVLRVPLAFRWPGRIPAGARIPGLVEAIDVAPTILDLVGVEIPDRFEGRTLAPALCGGAIVDPEHLAFSELEDRIVTVRSETHRYVHNPDGFEFPLTFEGQSRRIPFASEELYDLRIDPGERRDRVADQPAVAEAMRRAAVRWQDEHAWDEASRRHREQTVPDDVRERLEAIGYAR